MPAMMREWAEQAAQGGGAKAAGQRQAGAPTSISCSPVQLSSEAVGMHCHSIELLRPQCQPVGQQAP
jgi:hypothetical protein